MTKIRAIWLNIKGRLKKTGPTITPEDLALLKENAKQRYDSILSPVHCKCLNQKVYFNAKGFHHLLYDGSGKARKMQEVKAKLLLIPLIVPTLKNAVDSSYEKRYVRENRKKDSQSIKVEMWGVEATVGKNKIVVRVILKRVGDGNITFWSIMKIR